MSVREMFCEVGDDDGDDDDGDCNGAGTDDEQVLKDVTKDAPFWGPDAALDAATLLGDLARGIFYDCLRNTTSATKSFITMFKLRRIRTNRITIDQLIITIVRSYNDSYDLNYHRSFHVRS